MKKILVVDDRKDVLHLIQAKLEFSGIQSDVANTYSEAISLMINDYDIVISDLHLDDKCGLELLKKFKTYDTNVVAILYTAATLKDVDYLEIVDDVEVLNKDNTFDNLVDYIQLYCSKDKDKVIQILMTDIKKLKSEIIAHKIQIDNLHSISNNIFDIKQIVEVFIKNHQHDAIKIVVAISIFLTTIIFFIKSC